MDLLIKTGNFASHFKKMRRDYRGNCQLANEYNWPRDREFDEIVKDRQLFESKLVAFMKPDKGKSWKGKIPEFNRVLTDEEKKVIEELHTEMRTLVRALEHVLYTLRQQRKDATCYPPRMVWTSGWFEGTYCDDCDFMVAASDSVNWKRDIERGRYQEDDCYDMIFKISMWKNWIECGMDFTEVCIQKIN
jgi:hypothetical protein